MPLSANIVSGFYSAIFRFLAAPPRGRSPPGCPPRCHSGFRSQRTTARSADLVPTVTCTSYDDKLLGRLRSFALLGTGTFSCLRDNHPLTARTRLRRLARGQRCVNQVYGIRRLILVHISLYYYYRLALGRTSQAWLR